MKYKLLLEDTKIVGDQTLYRIQALKDFGNVKAGDLGGYIGSGLARGQGPRLDHGGVSDASALRPRAP